MKTSKIISHCLILITLVMSSGLVVNVLAQRPVPLPKCTANADQIYFVASGQQVSDEHPGGNGYQLNILGAAPISLQSKKSRI